MPYDKKIRRLIWSFGLSLLVIASADAQSTNSTAKPNAQRVVLYDEDVSDPKGKSYNGTVLWRTEETTGQQPPSRDLDAIADVEIPSRQLRMKWSFRRNTDKALPASHTIEIYFSMPPSFSLHNVANVPGVLLKANEKQRGVPLAGLSVKVTENHFLVGLSAKKPELQQNLQLLRERDWLDIPIMYSSGKRAILAVEIGRFGRQAIAAALGEPSGAAAPISVAEDPAINVAPPVVQDQDSSAPLGLTWGSTLEEVTSQGIELKPAPQNDFGETFIATKLPKALSDQELAILAFGFNDKLFRVMVVSRAHPNDPSGGSLRRRYSDLSAILAEKYGRPSSVESLGPYIYAQAEYFLLGIEGGYTNWHSDFDTQRVKVQLGLVADSSSSGRWRIIFEEKKLRGEFQATRKEKEKGAL